MASKKRRVRRHRPGKTGKPPAVLKLSGRARDEVADLLERSRAGTITRVDLQTGLKEVKAQLGVVSTFIFDFRNW